MTYLNIAEKMIVTYPNVNSIIKYKSIIQIVKIS